MSHVDWSKIGADRPFQDPEDAVRAATGTYSDPSATAPMEPKLPLVAFPKGPGPNPFGMIRRAGGAR